MNDEQLEEIKEAIQRADNSGLLCDIGEKLDMIANSAINTENTLSNIEALLQDIKTALENGK